MRITRLRGTAVAPDRICPRCGEARLRKLSFGGRGRPAPTSAHRD